MLSAHKFTMVLGAWVVLAATAGAGEGVPAQAPSPTPPIVAAIDQDSPSQAVLRGIDDRSCRSLALEVLERNPKLAALDAAAGAADQAAPQVRALPDPVAGVTAYLLSPETRVGPQQAMISLSQRLPWFGTLHLKEQSALLEATAARARVEAERLRLVTETRRLAYELAFTNAYESVVRQDRSILGHYEELARARYASGVGLEQGVVKIQAEITRDDARLLDIAARRASLEASINGLRDRPAGTQITVSALPAYPQLSPTVGALRERTFGARPELAEADARIQAAQAEIDLAQKATRPDVTVGLSYTLVGQRSDSAGRLNPPEGNGQDILALFGGVNLPIHREKIEAGIEAATDRRLAAEQARRATAADIEQSLADLASRIPLIWDRLQLFSNVLIVQARQSLASAEAGYAAGTLNALDLLDAERVLLDVRVATERARADYAIAVAQLEGTVGAPVVTGQES